MSPTMCASRDDRVRHQTATGRPHAPTYPRIAHSATGQRRHVLASQPAVRRLLLGVVRLHEGLEVDDRALHHPRTLDYVR
jgi:hypothetical protein